MIHATQKQNHADTLGYLQSELPDMIIFAGEIESHELHLEDATSVTLLSQKIRLAGHPFTCITIPPDTTNPSDIASVRNTCVTKFETQDLILFIGPLSSEARGRLVRYPVNFVSVNKQILIRADHLLLKFNEHIPGMIETRRKYPTRLTSAEFVILMWLVKSRAASATATSIKANLGYSVMTAGKVLERLVELALGSFTKEKREYVFHPADTGITLLERARSILDSPVEKRRWVTWTHDPAYKCSYWDSSLAALKKMGVAEESSHRTVAIQAARRDDFFGAPTVTSADQHTPGAVEVELWRFDPGKLVDVDDTARVGSLTLLLSLQSKLREKYEQLLLHRIEKK